MIFLSCMKHHVQAYDIFFTSLANENRLQIINTLRNKDHNVSEICKATGFEQTMVSHNLKRLERCGMVTPKKNGKFRIYSLNKKTIRPLMELIDHHIQHNCCKLVGKILKRRYKSRECTAQAVLLS